MRRRTTPYAAAAAIIALTMAGGCSREPGFEDRTAQLTIDGDTSRFTVDDCGKDGETVFVVGRSDDGAVLQAVVGVEDDGETGVVTSTGVTVTEVPEPVAAFGAESWARRGETGAAPGSITSARVRGARIQAAGDAQPVDVAGQPTSGDAVPFRLDARCDADDE